MFKKITTGIILAVLATALIMLAACGRNGEEATPAPTPDAVATPAPTPAADPTPAVSGFVPYDGITNFLVTEYPTDFTMFQAFGGLGAPEGHLPIWQEVARMTNMHMENVANPNIADGQESLNALLAGGLNALPDIIFGQVHMLQSVAAQGGFIPLDDLIAQYAPNIQAYFAHNADARIASAGADGVTNFIVGSLIATRGDTPASMLPSMMWFIRQDWLDELDMQIPTTFEEFEQVLYAFNEIPGAIPYFNRDRHVVGLYPLFGVPGSWAQWCVDPATNEVIHGRVTEEYRNALTTMARWWADGIIDPEIFTRGAQARQELWGLGTGGITFDWYRSTVNMNNNEDIRANNPDINIVPFLPPADVNGQVRNIYHTAPTSGWAWGISANAADPVAIIKLMDFMFSEPGTLLMSRGIEGRSFNMVDGQPVWTDEALNHEGGIPLYMGYLGVGGVHGVLEFDLSAHNPLEYEAHRLYVDSGILIPGFPTLSFTEAENDVIGRYAGPVQTMWEQFEQQVILGQRDITDDAVWRAYLAELDAVGFQQLLEVHNAAYQRWYAVHGGR